LSWISSEFSRIKGQRSTGAEAQRELIADYGDFHGLFDRHEGGINHELARITTNYSSARKGIAFGEAF